MTLYDRFFPPDSPDGPAARDEDYHLDEAVALAKNYRAQLIDLDEFREWHTVEVLEALHQLQLRVRTRLAHIGGDNA